MEEKRPGQNPEADRRADDPLQNAAARAGGLARAGSILPSRTRR